MSPHLMKQHRATLDSLTYYLEGGWIINTDDTRLAAATDTIAQLKMMAEMIAIHAGVRNGRQLKD